MKIDLHVHSKFSMRPSQWILKKIGCPESFTDPMQLYRIAKQKGMTHFTITDHNAIRGALEIAHLPDTFVSEEVTSYFPDDPCKVHVLALDITEAQHEDIQKARQDIYDLVTYLNRENIFHVLAHPLYAVNDRLTLDHVEKLFVLFRHFELNGSRNERENMTLKQVVRNLTPEKLDHLSDKHNLRPLYPNPAEKVFFGGSDDHSSINIARTYTEFKSCSSVRDAFQSASPSSVAVYSHTPTPLTMAHNLYAIAYQFYLSKVNLTRYAGKDVLLRFLDHSFRAESEEEFSPLEDNGSPLSFKVNDAFDNPVSGPLFDLLRKEAGQLFQDPDQSWLYDTSGDRAYSESRKEKKWFEFVNRISNRVMLHLGNHLLDHVSGANVFSLFHTMGSAGGLYSLLAPYFVAFSQFTRDRSFSREVAEAFQARAGNSPRNELNLAHFTDTFHDVNGVAITLRQHVGMARKNGKGYTLVTCHPEGAAPMNGVMNYMPTGTYPLPEYPELDVHFPPLLQMMQDSYDKGFNQIHTSTPGPIGLSALAIAKTLNIPITGTYHTQLPQFARALTGDPMIESLTWKYILWYYDQLDMIFAPSRETRNELVSRGIAEEKIRVYPRGIDVAGFHPDMKQDQRFNPGLETGRTHFLYVGRVSREKNLPVLEKAFALLCRKHTDVTLMVAGDGPYLDEMKQNMDGLPVRFTGYLKGDALKHLYAACDVFVFPSTTDTFGNVVLEAQASGTPVIVTHRGGPLENMVQNKTGLIVRGDDAQSLLNAMAELAHSPNRLSRMGRAARQYMESRSFEQAFLETWRMYEEVIGISHENRDDESLAQAV